MTVIIGTALIAGGIKGWLDNLFTPTPRRVIEHTPVYSRG